jgi:hypothetical protein
MTTIDYGNYFFEIDWELSHKWGDCEYDIDRMRTICSTADKSGNYHNNVESLRLYISYYDNPYEFNHINIKKNMYDYAQYLQEQNKGQNEIECIVNSFCTYYIDPKIPLLTPYMIKHHRLLIYITNQR